MNDDSLSSLSSDPDSLAARLMNSAHLGDGLPEIAAGLIFLLYSAMTWSRHLAQHHSAAGRISAPILLCVIILTGFAAAPLIRWVRISLLTAHSGYVRRKPRIWRASSVLATVVLVGAILTLVALGLKGILAQRWLLMITGILLGGLWMLFGRRRRFVVNGLLIVSAAVLIAISALQTEIAWTSFYAFAGILTVASGTMVLRRHIRRTPEQSQ